MALTDDLCYNLSMDKIRLSVESKLTQWTPEHLQDIAQRYHDWRNPIPMKQEPFPYEKRRQGILCFDDVPNQRAVYYATADFIRERGQYPTYDDLVAITGCSKSAILQTVQTLEIYDFLSVTLNETGPKTNAEDTPLKVRALKSRRHETDDDRRRIKDARDNRRVFVKRKASANRRARQLGIKGRTHTFDLIQMKQSQKNKCWWCSRDLTDGHHVDHRVPLHRGGTNDTGNLCLSCPDCNLKKHDKMPWEFCGRLL